ncbi:MAG: hypothetical protein RQ761_12060 [Bacteroidales bacterium]|nr:hypothetical protein [Bacteroidales bacterium]
MINETDIELAEQYLEGSIEGENLRAFEERLEKEPDLRQFIETRQAIGKAWRGAGEYLEARKWVKNSIDAHVKQKSRSTNRTLWYSIAALIIVSFAIWGVMRLDNGRDEQKPLIAEDTSAIRLEVHPGTEREQKARLDTAKRAPALLSMIEGESSLTSDTITFKWKDGDAFKELFIARTENDSVVYTYNLKPGQHIYILLPGTLQSGSYYWYLDQPLVKGHFIIMEE